MAVDPRSDGLYLWWSKLFRLDAKTGEVDLQEDLPEEAHGCDGIVASGRDLLPNARDLARDVSRAGARVFHLQLGELVEVDLDLLQGMSPDERKYLKGLACYSLPDRELMWSYATTGRGVVAPFWMDGDVVSLNGSRLGTAEVVRLDGETGELRWRYLLPRGAYEPGMDQLRDGSYAKDDWSPVGMAGEQVLAVGGDGRLFFLDPLTGELVATASPGDMHLTFPHLVEGSLAVFSESFSRAIPMDMVLGQARPNEKDLLILKARINVARGRLPEARRILEHLVAQDPESARGWKRLGTVLGTERDPLAEVAAWSRYLSLTQRENCAPLREKWGLQRRIPTGNDIIARPLHIGNRVFVGTSAGWLYELDSRAGRLLRKTRHRRAVNGLRPVLELGAFAYSGGEHPLLAGWEQPYEATPDSAAVGWNTRTGYDGRAVYYKGRYFRPLKGGTVRMLADGQLSHHRGDVDGM
jgi:hypothetical protein